MSARDHLHPEQLAMFMPAHAIAAMHLGDSPDQSDEGRHQTIFEKQDENVTSHYGRVHMGDTTVNGVQQSYVTRQRMFDTEGVREPVTIAHQKTTKAVYEGGGRKFVPHTETFLEEGHHRLAWAMNKNPSTELPVEHESYGHD